MIELPIHESIKMLGEKLNYEYMEIMGTDSIKQRWKEKDEKRLLLKNLNIFRNQAL